MTKNNSDNINNDCDKDESSDENVSLQFDIEIWLISENETNPVCTFVFPACGGIISNLNTVIQSPSYPNSYPNGITCVWQVVLPGKQISLNFDNFHTQQGYDFLKVNNRVDLFNGMNSKKHPTVRKFFSIIFDIKLYLESTR